MGSLGATHLVVIVVLVALAVDSRRLHDLARATRRTRRGGGWERGIPPGANPDQVGITLRQIQMRIHVDWQDGGIGWDGPEILPGDDADDDPVEDAEPVDPPAPAGALVLWQPFRALPAGRHDRRAEPAADCAA
jgi:hypothetical protein